MRFKALSKTSIRFNLMVLHVLTSVAPVPFPALNEHTGSGRALHSRATLAVSSHRLKIAESPFLKNEEVHKFLSGVQFTLKHIDEFHNPCACRMSVKFLKCSSVRHSEDRDIATSCRSPCKYRMVMWFCVMSQAASPDLHFVNVYAGPSHLKVHRGCGRSAKSSCKCTDAEQGWISRSYVSCVWFLNLRRSILRARHHLLTSARVQWFAASRIFSRLSPRLVSHHCIEVFHSL